MTGQPSLTNLSVEFTDEDWYSTEVPANSTLQVNLLQHESYYDVDLEFRGDCTGTSFATGMASGGATIATYDSGDTPKTVYIRVRLPGGIGLTNYDLAVSLQDHSNNSCESAESVGPGVYPGRSVGGFALDWFTVATSFGSNTTIRVNFEHDVGNLELQAYAGCIGGILVSSRSVTDNEAISYLNDDSNPPTTLYSWVQNIDRMRQVPYTLTVSQVSNFYGSDDCDSAIPISGLRIFTFDSMTATKDGEPHPLCNASGSSDIDHDVWFDWTAMSTGTVNIQFCDSPTSIDSKIAEYEGDGCTGQLLACNDDSCALKPEVSFHAIAGNSYKLRIGTSDGSPPGNGLFTISQNDVYAPSYNCSVAATLTEGYYPDLFVAFDGPGDEDWWHIAVPANARITVDLLYDEGVQFSEVGDFFLYRQGGASCPGGAAGTIATPISGGLRYEFNNSGPALPFFARVENHSNEYGATYALDIRFTPIEDPLEPNNNCGAAVPVTEGRHEDLRCFNDNCYFVTVPSGAQLRAEAFFQHADGNLTLRLLDGCSTLVAESATNDDNELASWRNDGAVRAYMIQVAGGGQPDGVDYDLDGRIERYGADDGEAALPIVGFGTFPFDNTLAQKDGLPHGLCTSFGYDDINHDVWLDWTATVTGLTTMSLCPNGTTIDSKIAAYDGASCPGPVLVCNDDTCDLLSQIQFDAVAGQNYKLRIGNLPDTPINRIDKWLPDRWKITSANPPTEPSTSSD